MPEPRCWVVTEGHVGLVNQARGLAEAAGFEPEVKSVGLRFPWTLVPPRLMLPPLGALARHGQRLAPPWPDLLISCGRHGAVAAMAVRRASGGRTFTVHVQDPQVDPRRFDLVVAPEHDRRPALAAGDNVIFTRAALHRVTPERLAAAAAACGGRFAHLPRPLVAVLIGGTSRRHRLSAGVARRLAASLAAMARAHGAGLLVTTSRRTGAGNEAILRQGLEGVPAVIWDGQGENPYFAFLGLADAMVVTSDSVSMISEACSTGKPVYVADLDGGSRRFTRFQRGLEQAGMVRPFDGTLAEWRYDPPDDTARAAAEICRRMGLA